MINLSIARDLTDLYPGVRVASFIATGRPDQEKIETTVRRLAEDSLHSLTNRKINIDNLADTQPFASWRRAFAKGGLQPSKYRSSVEALVRRALRSDQPVLTSNPIVDIYNALSVKHVVPMGAYDITRLPQPSVDLRLARPESDRFQPVGGDPTKYPLKTGMPVYASASEIVCYGFNHRDSTVTACHQASDQILFISEIVDDDMLSGLQNALTELRDALAALGMDTSEISAAGQS